LYVGAAAALLVCLTFRPRPTKAVLWAHGLMLLLMVPFGYHLLPQNGEIRTLLGQLFAVGLVGYLALLPASLAGWRYRGNRWTWGYGLGVLASLAALQWAVHARFVLAGEVLAWLGLTGLAVLVLLGIANLVLIPWVLWRAVRRARAAASP
jgi:hypothetical protein